MKYYLADHIMSYTDDDVQERYLLNLDNNDTFLLNDISAYLIEAIEKESDIETTIKMLYCFVKDQISFEKLEYDVNEFLYRLEEEGFILKEEF